MSLASAAVLIVEDEPFVALDLALSVEDAGGRVIGPAATLEALTLVGQHVSAAILDVHLPDGDVGPVLHMLMARGVPVVVQTEGGLLAKLKNAYPDLVVLLEPNDPSRLIAYLSDCLAAAN